MGGDILSTTDKVAMLKFGFSESDILKIKHRGECFYTEVFDELSVIHNESEYNNLYMHFGFMGTFIIELQIEIKANTVKIEYNLHNLPRSSKKVYPLSEYNNIVRWILCSNTNPDLGVAWDPEIDYCVTFARIGTEYDRRCKYFTKNW
jgi:hypothetical protein